MAIWARVSAAVAFSVSATLALMFAISRFPGLDIPVPYWIFGALCPAVLSFTVSLLLARQTERIRELQGQRDALVELLSHDMRAPQASIITLLDHAESGWTPDLAARIRVYAVRTLKLADDMVHLSRAQMPNYRLEELDLGEIARDAVDALVPQAGVRRVAFELTGDADVVLVRGEPSLLVRALINLLDNAVAFSPAGGVVRFAISRPARDRVVCAISDPGPGIPPELRIGLFQRFAPGRVGGAGLGLALVKTVVERHGGTIACDSGADRGTTFRLELPALA